MDHINNFFDFLNSYKLEVHGLYLFYKECNVEEPQEYLMKSNQLYTNFILEISSGKKSIDYLLLKNKLTQIESSFKDFYYNEIDTYDPHNVTKPKKISKEEAQVIVESQIGKVHSICISEFELIGHASRMLEHFSKALVQSQEVEVQHEIKENYSPKDVIDWTDEQILLVAIFQLLRNAGKFVFNSKLKYVGTKADEVHLKDFISTNFTYQGNEITYRMVEKNLSTLRNRADHDAVAAQKKRKDKAIRILDTFVFPKLETIARFTEEIRNSEFNSHNPPVEK